MDTVSNFSTFDHVVENTSTNSRLNFEKICIKKFLYDDSKDVFASKLGGSFNMYAKALNQLFNKDDWWSTDPNLTQPLQKSIETFCFEDFVELLEYRRAALEAYHRNIFLQDVEKNRDESLYGLVVIRTLCSGPLVHLPWRE